MLDTETTPFYLWNCGVIVVLLWSQHKYEPFNLIVLCAIGKIDGWNKQVFKIEKLGKQISTWFRLFLKWHDGFVGTWKDKITSCVLLTYLLKNLTVQYLYIVYGKVHVIIRLTFHVNFCLLKRIVFGYDSTVLLRIKFKGFNNKLCETMSEQRFC